MVVRSAIGVVSVSWYALTLVLVAHGQSVGPRWRLGRQRKSRSRSEEQPARSRSQSRPTQLVASRARLASGHLHHGRLLVLGLVRRQPSSSWTCELHLRSRVFRQHTIARTRERTSERTNERASERTVHLLHINRRKLASGCGVTREIEALSLWVRVSQPGDEARMSEPTKARCDDVRDTYMALGVGGIKLDHILLVVLLIVDLWRGFDQRRLGGGSRSRGSRPATRRWSARRRGSGASARS